MEQHVAQGPETEPPITGEQIRKAKNTQLLRLASNECRPSGENLREWGTDANKARVQKFAQTILDGGIRNPLTMSRGPDGIWLIEDGETRWRAVRFLEGWDELEQKAVPVQREPGLIKIPAQIAERTANEVDRLTDLMVRQSGSDLSDFEKAKGIKQYVRYGYQQIEIAAKLGWNPVTIGILHTFNQAPEALRVLVRDGRISAQTIVSEFRATGGARANDPVAAWQEVEKKILDSIKHLRGDAGREYEEAMGEARHWTAEAQRLADSPEGNEPASASGKRPRGMKPITRRETALRNAANAAQRADRARQLQEQGPSRISSGDILAAQASANPEAVPEPKMSRTIYGALLDCVRYVAAYSIDQQTRDGCNETLTKYGFQPVASKVDQVVDQVDQPAESEIVGETIAETETSEASLPAAEPTEGSSIAA